MSSKPQLCLVCALLSLCTACGLPGDPFGLREIEDEGPCRTEERCIKPSEGPPINYDLPILAARTTPAKLLPIESCEQLAAHAAEHYVERWLATHHHQILPSCTYARVGDCRQESQWNNSNGWGGAQDMASFDQSTSPPVEPPAGPTDLSGTNVQERTVDEADIIKSDGAHIYIVEPGRGRVRVRVIASWPAEEADNLAVINLPGAEDASLLLAGPRLIIAANEGSGAKLLVYDVADPSAPALEGSLVLPARVEHVRMVKGRVHMVAVTPWDTRPAADALQSEARARALPQSPQLDEQYWLIAQSRRRIHEAIPAQLPQLASAQRDALPVAQLTRGDQTTALPLYATGCAGLYVQDARPNDPALLNLISVDPADLTTARATGVVMQHDLLYTSPTHLYVTERSGEVNAGRAARDLGRQNIYRFALDRDAAPTLTGQTSVTGAILPDLAMSEHAGKLRVFTNEDNLTTSLTIFGDVDGQMEKIGGLTGIAPQEKATAARMVGDRLYVLTAKGSGITSPALPPEHPQFQRICDPLFVIDAADPTQPKILGDLDFPGFSAYVHPIGPDHLLSLGRDEQLKLRLQVFDVSNTAQPVIAHEHTISRPDHIHLSEAQDDRLRFVYHGARKLLAIPVTEQSMITRNTTFRGQLLFRAGIDGIAPIGVVEHSALNGATCDAASCEAPPIGASMFIEHYLYSFSNAGFMIHATEAEQATALRAVPY